MPAACAPCCLRSVTPCDVSHRRHLLLVHSCRRVILCIARALVRRHNTAWPCRSGCHGRSGARTGEYHSTDATKCCFPRIWGAWHPQLCALVQPALTRECHGVIRSWGLQGSQRAAALSAAWDPGRPQLGHVDSAVQSVAAASLGGVQQTFWRRAVAGRCSQGRSWRRHAHGTQAAPVDDVMPRRSERPSRLAEPADLTTLYWHCGLQERAATLPSCTIGPAARSRRRERRSRAGSCAASLRDQGPTGWQGKQSHPQLRLGAKTVAGASF